MIFQIGQRLRQSNQVKRQLWTVPSGTTGLVTPEFIPGDSAWWWWPDLSCTVPRHLPENPATNRWLSGVEARDVWLSHSKQILLHTLSLFFAFGCIPPINSSPAKFKQVEWQLAAGLLWRNSNSWWLNFFLLHNPWKTFAPNGLIFTRFWLFLFGI